MENTPNPGTTVYNVIILDKSGSMSSIAKQAVIGVNESLGSIRSQQKKAKEEDKPIHHKVTLVAFCGCELRQIYDAVPIEETRDITEQDYTPCCMTPLYDAIGNTCTRIHTLVADKPRDSVAVTIITDGYENASREFSGKAIKSLIDAYKSEGWMFAYIGADHDVEAVAKNLEIDNVMQFDKSEAGTRTMFRRASMAREAWANDMADCSIAPEMSDDELLEAKRKRSKRFFDDWL